MNCDGSGLDGFLVKALLRNDPPIVGYWGGAVLVEVTVPIVDHRCNGLGVNLSVGEKGGEGGV